MPSVSQLIGGHEPSMSGIKEQKLNEIVNAIGSCSYKTMKDLGFAMGFQKVDIDQYVASNHQNGTVSLRGITDMVFSWKSKTSPANQMRFLREALIKAKLIEIADTFLPKNETVTHLERTVTSLQTSATQTVGLNTAAARTGIACISNHQNRVVSLRGITDMMNPSYANQFSFYREAQRIRAESHIKIADINDMYLPKNDRPVTYRSYLERIVATLHTSRSATQTVGLNTAAAQTGQEQSVELLCLKCERVTAKITNVMNTKRSEDAVRSKVRNIMGRECLVQLMETEIDNRYDVITVTTADVKLDDEVFQIDGYEGYEEHRCTFCKGCSQQVGWYYTPTDGSSAPFHALWLQRLIHDSYDSDNSLNVFFAQTLIE